MPRIVLVGAGSVEFTKNLLGDILSSPALRTAEIVLHDIDPDRLATAERMAKWTAGALGAEPTISTHLDRRQAPRGADFVVDTVGVGGVFRGLQTVPVVLGIARDMAEVCPDAWLLNYTNPLAGYLGLPREEIDADSAGLFVVAQRQFVRGIAMTGIKG